MSLDLNQEAICSTYIHVIIEPLDWEITCMQYTIVEVYGMLVSQGTHSIAIH